MAANEKRKIEITASVTDKATAGLQKVGNSLKALAKTARGALGSLPSLLGALVAGAAVKRGVGIFGELASGLEKVSAAAASTNNTADSLYLLRNAVGETGVGFEAVSAAMRTFEKNLGDARLGAIAQNQALELLGLTTDQFAGDQKDAIESVALVADGLSKITDASVRTKVALSLFGEDTGAKLLPVLTQGGKALRDYAAAQKAAGLSLSSEDIQRATDYTVAVERLKNTFATFAEQIVVDAAPAVTGFINDLKRAVDENAPEIRAGMLDILQVVTEGAEVIIDIGFVVRKSVLGWDLLGKSLAKVYLDMFGTTEAAAAATRRLNESNDAVAANDAAWEELGKRFDSIQAKYRKLRGEQTKQITDSVRDPTNLDPMRVDVVASKPTELEQYFAGFNEQIDVSIDRWTDFSAAGKAASDQLVDRGLGRLADTFADIITHTKSAKEAFRAFAQAMLSDLSRIITRLLIMRAVSELFGGEDTVKAESGGVVQGQMGKPVKLESFESGGIARGPTLALFGEGRASKGEAFVPLPDGRSIPVTMRGGGAATNITFNISAMDGRDVQRMLIEQRETIGGIIRNQAQTVGMRQVLQRATS